MKRALILIPTIGKTDRQIDRSKQACLKYAAVHNLEPVEIIQELLDDEFAELSSQIHFSYPMYQLSYAGKVMSSCDSVVFGKGWENLLGYKMAHAVAVAYGLEVYYEEKIENERSQHHENQKAQCH